MLAKNSHRNIKAVIAATQDATANTIANIVGEDVEVVCLSGNLWINPFGATAVADTTAIKLIAGQSVSFCNGKGLSMISDATGSDYQIIVMGF